MSEVFINPNTVNADVWKLITKDLILVDRRFVDVEDISVEDWKYLCGTKVLSESFIRKYQNKVYWRFVFTYQTHISEDFLREFQGKPFWTWIFKHRKNLSDSFIKEFNQ